MAFRQENLDTGLAATALGALVLFALLLGGFLVLGRLSGNVLFGTNIDAGDPFEVLAPVAVREPAASVSVDAPPPADPAPAPAPDVPTPEAPAPAVPPPAAPPPVTPDQTPPAPAPDSAPSPLPSPIPDVPTLSDTIEDPVGSVGRVATSTVEGAGSLVGKLLETALDPLSKDDH